MTHEPTSGPTTPVRALLARWLAALPARAYRARLLLARWLAGLPPA